MGIEQSYASSFFILTCPYLGTEKIYLCNIIRYSERWISCFFTINVFQVFCFVYYVFYILDHLLEMVELLRRY